jgi:glucose/arabinose dehydrogenase/N-acetylneuraminic acid mutarotase
MSNRSRGQRRLKILMVLSVLLGSLAVPFASDPADAIENYTLQRSTQANRSNPGPLAGATVSGNIYVFIAPEIEVAQVKFWIDDPTRSGPPVQTENGAPYDLEGTAPGGDANPLNTATMSPGAHSITARVVRTVGGVQIVTANFTVGASTPSLVFSPPTLSLSGTPGGSSVSSIASLTSSDGASVSASISDNQPWLSATPNPATTPAGMTITANPGALAAGTYNGTVTATAAGRNPGTLAVTFTVAASGPSYSLQLSTQATRANPGPLAGATVSGNIYVFTSPEAGATRVNFYIDNPGATGPPFRTEGNAPFDFAGTHANGTALPYATSALSNGAHSITAVVETASGNVNLTSNFTVANGVASLQFAPATIALSAEPGGAPVSDVTTLSAADAAAVSFSVSDNAPWLTVSPTSGTTPRSLTITGNPAGLAQGQYSATVTATSPSRGPASLPVTMQVGLPPCEPIACEDIRVDLPYAPDWATDSQFLEDGSGVGTGFTWVNERPNGTGYLPNNLDLVPAAAALDITTTSGRPTTGSNSQDNMLGVGIDAPSQVTEMSVTVHNIPAGTGKFEQSGLWFGIDQDSYIKLVVMSAPAATKIQLFYERDGATVEVIERNFAGAVGQDVELQLIADPVTRSVSGKYGLVGGSKTTLGPVVIADEMFSFDGAGIDPRIGTRSFGGVMASHVNATSAFVARFTDFSVVAGDDAPPTSPLSFQRSSFALSSPTSMAWGPDGKLYVSELFGTIHKITLAADKSLVSDQVITTLGSRFTLGITIDPASTPTNVILWAAHSSPSVDNGVLNSGIVSRLTGPNLATKTDVITGIPRAKANHGTNSIHFGPDGKLYIAQGGNTGAGAPTTAPTEFGDRQEQPLSAALLVADVKATGFDGTCANTSDPHGPAPCHVTPYATGMRNMYDFVFHTNGQLYGADNGLGVTGAFPPSPTPPCLGNGNTQPWNQGGHNPGTQPDLLYRIQQGKYYGHPNPHRNECVFKDGSFQGVSAPANFVPPMYVLGDHLSANGMLEYKANRFCGALKGDLLIANYSVGDDLTRIDLSANGLTVTSKTSLIGGFSGPLPIVEGPDGTIYVGEFNSNEITALVPNDTAANGCWSDAAPLPTNLLDPGSAVVNGKLYVVAGKTSTGPQNTVYVYDPVANSWSTAAPLPGPAVENPAAVSFNGQLYVFGGSTTAFAGAVGNAAVYNPATNAWTTRAAMPTPRGGPGAQVVGSLIYVVGGMNGSGSSVSTVEAYNPATNTWSARPAMASRRDNPMTASVGGKLYVFGGRIRESDGTTTNGTLNTVEMFDPAVGSWAARAPMPTGRRTGVAGIINGRVLVMGGEVTATGGTFVANEEYNPATNTWRTLAPMPIGRHGAAAGVINGVMHVVAGGSTGGSSFTNIHHTFIPPP